MALRESIQPNYYYKRGFCRMRANQHKPMKRLTLLLFILNCIAAYPQDNFEVRSPDGQIAFIINNGDKLTYSVTFRGKEIVQPSVLGFEFRSEPAMAGNFVVTGKNLSSFNQKWIPVVKSKHAEIENKYSELHLTLLEKDKEKRQIELFVRVFNDGAAFRFKLLRSGKPGDREVTRELTEFNIPDDPKAWIVEYGGYSTSNEAEFFERRLSYLNEKSIAGMPLLIQHDSSWLAITEADIDNYASFYIGTNGNTNQLTTRLVPLPGEPENGVKVRFSDEVFTPWRVLMIGETPGTLIESEIIQNLNEPCAIKDPSWIKPGMCAWDHWWSGEVKMEMPVIRQYIDLASSMGWPYMLVDWQWYGKFNDPGADITKWAPQIDMPEIIRYAASKNVKIIVWLYSSDANRNSAYKKAFPLYRQWGLAGVKIDFMDRDDQQMVNWYRDIIKCAAENHLLVDFHGAYKPDGIIRTWPNMITREGVMGNEYYKFSEKMSPEHNVKLAFTRMLAGQMDYTPGAFLNVTREQFKNQTPAIVWNTRAAELSKFVIYESPLTVVCDHPDNILNQPGAVFLKIVPTTWDNIKFLGGYPGEYVAIAKQSGDVWFLGVMNNSKKRDISIKLDFLPQGSWEVETWSDAKDSGKVPSSVNISKTTDKAGSMMKVSMAENGGFAAVFRKTN
jgi:alpha-glucosidase